MSGAALLASDAPMLPPAPQMLVEYGYAGLLVLLVLGIVGLPLPDETLIMAAGFLVRRGDLHAVPTFAVAVIGSTCGITLSYVIGRTAGAGLLDRAQTWLHLTAEKRARFERWYATMGRWALMVGYFVPGLRHVVAIGAGTSRLPWHTFALFAYLGAIVWVATFLVTGYVLGREWERSSPGLRIAIVAVGLGLIVVVGVLTWVRRKRQRR
jgi:membrane protein DedA with SNARE-associated domain